MAETVLSQVQAAEMGFLRRVHGVTLHEFTALRRVHGVTKYAAAKFPKP